MPKQFKGKKKPAAVSKKALPAVKRQLLPNNEALCNTCVWRVKNPLALTKTAAKESEVALLFPRENGPLIALFGLSLPKVSVEERKRSGTSAYFSDETTTGVGEEKDGYDVALLAKMASLLITHPTAITSVHSTLPAPLSIGQPDMLSILESDSLNYELDVSENGCYPFHVDQPEWKKKKKISDSLGNAVLVKNIGFRGNELQHYSEPYHAILCGDTDSALIVGQARIKREGSEKFLLQYLRACCMTGDVTSLRFLFTNPILSKKVPAKFLGFPKYQLPHLSTVAHLAEEDESRNSSSSRLSSDASFEEELLDDDSWGLGSSEEEEEDEGDEDEEEADSEYDPKFYIFADLYDSIEGERINGTKTLLFLVHLNNKRVDDVLYPHLFRPYSAFAPQGTVTVPVTRVQSSPFCTLRNARKSIETAIENNSLRESPIIQWHKADLAWYLDLSIGMVLKGETLLVELDEGSGTVGYHQDGFQRKSPLLNPSVESGLAEEAEARKALVPVARMQLQKVLMDLRPREERFWANMTTLMDKDDVVELKVPDRSFLKSERLKIERLNRAAVCVRCIEMNPKDFFGWHELGWCLGWQGSTEIFLDSSAGGIRTLDGFQALEKAQALAEDESDEDNEADELDLTAIFDYRHRLLSDKIIALRDQSMAIKSLCEELIASFHLSQKKAPCNPFLLLRIASILSCGQQTYGPAWNRLAKAARDFVETTIVPAFWDRDPGLLRTLAAMVRPDLASDLIEKSGSDKKQLAVVASSSCINVDFSDQDKCRLFASLAFMIATHNFEGQWDHEMIVNDGEILTLALETILWYNSTVTTFTSDKQNVSMLGMEPPGFKKPTGREPPLIDDEDEEWEDDSPSSSAYDDDTSSEEEDDEDEEEEDEEDPIWTRIVELPDSLVHPRDLDRLTRWEQSQTRQS